MFLRFKEIRNTGRFRSASPAGRSFEQKTIIFGNNGNGKSTLTAIFRSLSLNDAGLINERNTFGETGKPTVKVVVEKSGTNKDIKFDTTWSEAVPEIRVFDSKFISENIFDGEKLEDIHKSKLHRVIVGEVGKKLADTIDHIGDEIRNRTVEKNQIVQEYSRVNTLRELPFEEFLALKEDPNIDNKIKSLESDVEFAGLAGKPELPKNYQYDFASTKRALQGSSETAHAAAKERIETHVKKHWKNGSHRREFFDEGLQLINDSGCCPFCSQPLDAVKDLIGAYSTFFDEAYRIWEKSLREATAKFRSWNLNAQITSLESTIKDWKKYLPDECEEISTWLEANKESILQSKSDFDQQCENKLANLEHHEVDFQSLDQLHKKMEALAIMADDLNEKIVAYKAKLGTGDINNLQLNLKVALKTKDRYSKEYIDLCGRYLQLQKEALELGAKRDAVIEELTAYSEKTFRTHQDKINETLVAIGADFCITDFSEKTDRRKQGAVFCGFELVFFERHRVPLNPTAPAGPSFHNTLSQGDKNLLAFAFFISSLWNDANLEEKIVVIDDPISSFDNERKEATVYMLSRISSENEQTPKQIIILTHELDFLDKLTRNPYFTSAKYLRIVNSGVSENGCKESEIMDCDPKKDLLKDIVRKYTEELKEILDGNIPVPSDAHAKCRIILENLLMTKYYLELKDLPREASLGAYVEELKRLKIYDNSKAMEFDSIIHKLHEPHHNPSPASSNSDGDISFVIRETFRLRGLI